MIKSRKTISRLSNADNYGLNCCSQGRILKERVLNSRGKGFTLLEIVSALSIISILAAIATFNYSGYTKRASDTVAQEDLRQAYSSAVNYFIDHPTGILTRADLDNYGFKASPNVNVMIINGRLSDLILISSYSTPGAQVYIASRQGMSQPGPSGEPNQVGGGGSASKGPQNSNPGEIDHQQSNPGGNSDVVKLCNQATIMDLMDAYRVAQGYLGRYPGQQITKDILMANGYVPNEEVSLVILNGTSSDLSMSGIFNFSEATNYVIDRDGITSAN